MAEQLYQIVDEFPYQEKVTTYHNLTLEQAAIRMDDLIEVGEQTILEDWSEPCDLCKGFCTVIDPTELAPTPGYPRRRVPCFRCDADGKWPGPWEHTDPDTGREVTMTRAPTERTP